MVNQHFTGSCARIDYAQPVDVTPAADKGFPHHDKYSALLISSRRVAILIRRSLCTASGDTTFKAKSAQLVRAGDKDEARPRTCRHSPGRCGLPIDTGLKVMTLPFSQSDFFAVFARYNESVWPAQIILYALAVAAVFLAFRESIRSTRAVYLVLAIFWLWMGAVYHASFFAAINPAAFGFAAAFVFQSVLFFVLATRRNAPLLIPDKTFAGISGRVLVIAALVIYPLLNAVANHRYPTQPTFGLPCPTTIFTLGILLWAVDRIPRYVLVIPLLWAVIATFAAVQLGVMEDLVLSVSAVVFIAGFVASRQRSSLHVHA